MSMLKIVTGVILIAATVAEAGSAKEEVEQRSGFIQLEDGHGVNWSVYATDQLSAKPETDAEATSTDSGNDADLFGHVIHDMNAIEKERHIRRYWNLGTADAPFWCVYDLRYV